MSIATRIKTEMGQVSGMLCSHIHNRSGVTSDDVSAAVERFLPETEELVELPNRDSL